MKAKLLWETNPAKCQIAGDIVSKNRKVQRDVSSETFSVRNQTSVLTCFNVS